MKTHTHQVYSFEELSDEAKENAISRCWDWNVDHAEWYDFVFDDAKEVGKILGIEIENIYFSGFSSQGDGAQFVGNYAYAKNSLAKIKEYAPQDTELIAIAARLQELQKPFFYGLTANVKSTGRYSHEYCTYIDVEKTDFTECWGGDTWVSDATESALSDLLRDFMRWIYKRLNSEFDYLVSEEAIKESLISNEVEFNEDGTMHR